MKIQFAKFLFLLMLTSRTAIGQVSISNDSIFINDTFVAFNSNEILFYGELYGEPRSTIKILVFKPIKRNERKQIEAAINRDANPRVSCYFIDVISADAKLQFAGAYLEKSAKNRANALMVGLYSGLVASLPTIASLPAVANYVVLSPIVPQIFIGVAIAGAVVAVLLEVESIKNTRKAGKALRH